MSRLTQALRAVWEFVVGDDPSTALGVILALAGTAAVADTGVKAWWVTPIAVGLVLVLSLWRASR